MSRRTPHAVALASCVLAVLAGAPGAQQLPQLRITDPAPDEPVAGPIVLRAELNPATDLRRIDFFVDGTLVCRVERQPFECEFDAGSDVRSRLIRVTATLASGERLVQTVRTGTLTITERAAVDAVLVPAVVTDGDDKFVKGLRREDFRIYEDGVPQQIGYFQSENIPLEISIAVDVSASVGPVLPTVQAAARRFLRQLKPIDRVTLVAFNDRTFVLLRRETDSAARLAAVDRLVASGGTALYDAMVTSLDLIGGSISRRAVIVFTDGADTRSLVSRGPVERRIMESDATVYMITHGVGEPADAVRRQTRQLAEISGGRAFPVARLSELEQAFDFIHDDLESQYLIGYEPTNAKRDDGMRRLRVETVNRNYRVRARDGYRPTAR